MSLADAALRACRKMGSMVSEAVANPVRAKVSLSSSFDLSWRTHPDTVRTSIEPREYRGGILYNTNDQSSTPKKTESQFRDPGRRRMWRGRRVREAVAQQAGFAC